jgi:hypothetical protein
MREKITGWQVTDLRRGGVLDKGLGVGLLLEFTDGAEHALLLPHEVAETCIALLLSLTAEAHRIRSDLGLPDTAETPPLAPKSAWIAGTAGGGDVVLRIRTQGDVTLDVPLTAELAAELEQGLQRARARQQPADAAANHVA